MANSRMRIAMLSWESLHSIAIGGVAAHVTELAAALERMGHEVHVFTRMAPGQRFHDVHDGVHYHRCPYASHPSFVDDVNNMCRAFVERLFAVEDYVGSFDIVHAHDWLTANALIWIKQGRGQRCVLTMHSTEYARCGNTFPNGQSQRVREQERSGLYWADRVIAVSSATKAELAWMYETPDAKMAVVYNGVSPHRFDIDVDAGLVKQQYKIGPIDPVVLFCGRLVWQKGPDLLVEAIPHILRVHPKAHFVFAGDGHMRGSLEQRARQLGIANQARFVGHVEGEELVKLFKACDTVCVCSRNEPFGIVVLEAWSARKPVVATQVGGPNEYVWHEVNGLKIHPRVDSVSWGVNSIFYDFEKSRWMGDNGRHAVETAFTWDTIAKQTLDVYAPQVETVTAAASTELAQAATPEPVAAEPLPDAALQVVAELSFQRDHREVLAQQLLVACEEELADVHCKVGRHGRCLWIEGECDMVFAALRRCHRLINRLGAAQAADTNIRLQPRRSLPTPEDRPAEVGVAVDAVRILTTALDRQPVN